MNLPLIAIALAQAPPRTTSSPNPMNFVFFAMLGAMVVFMLLTSRSQKKREKREREEMFARMAKNDRVQTIGGVIGTVVSVKESEVIVKVDESTNTKMTFMKTAVQRILSDEGQTAEAKR